MWHKPNCISTFAVRIPVYTVCSHGPNPQDSGGPGGQYWKGWWRPPRLFYQSGLTYSEASTRNRQTPEKILEPLGLGASSRIESHQLSISLAEPERQLLSSKPWDRDEVSLTKVLVPKVPHLEDPSQPLQASIFQNKESMFTAERQLLF